jgi:AcrR family transcriptional regulator
MVRTPSPERRAQFMRSALKLFVASGVQNASTAAIAKDAGSAAGTLFLYFPTKQDLIHELVLQIGQQQSEYIKTRLETSVSVRETFYQIWDGSIRWFLENRDAYQYIKQVRDSGLIHEDVVRDSEKFFTYYYEAIQKGFTQKRIKPYPIELIGGMLYQDVAAVMNLITIQPDKTKQDEYIQVGFDIFWDGIKTNADQSKITWEDR